MAEIKTPPIISYDENGDEIVSFGADHTWSDVARWIAADPIIEEFKILLDDAREPKT